MLLRQNVRGFSLLLNLIVQKQIFSGTTIFKISYIILYLLFHDHSNISHELRTPLTLVLSPLEDILAIAELSPDLKVSCTIKKKKLTQIIILMLIKFYRIV